MGSIQYTAAACALHHVCHPYAYYHDINMYVVSYCRIDHHHYNPTPSPTTTVYKKHVVSIDLTNTSTLAVITNLLSLLYNVSHCDTHSQNKSTKLLDYSSMPSVSDLLSTKLCTSNCNLRLECSIGPVFFSVARPVFLLPYDQVPEQYLVP